MRGGGEGRLEPALEAAEALAEVPQLGSAEPAGQHAADREKRQRARSCDAGDSWMCAATSGVTRDLP